MKTQASKHKNTPPGTTPGASAETPVDMAGAPALAGAPAEAELPVDLKGKSVIDVAYDLLQREQRKGPLTRGWSDFLAEADELIAAAGASHTDRAPTPAQPTDADRMSALQSEPAAPGNADNAVTK